MNRIHIQLAAAILAVVVTGCSPNDADSATTSPGPGEPTATEEATVSTTPRELWDSFGLGTYTLMYAYVPSDEGFTVEVVDGVPVRIVHTNGETRLPERMPPDAPTSVEGFFEVIDANSGAYSLVVDYNDELGYPTRILIDPEDGVEDDEWGYTITLVTE